MDKDVLALVLRARKRDSDAFALLIERFERTALATAFGQLHDGHRAGDAVQEAFLRAWQELPRLQEPERFGGWLLQIVRNAAIDMRRRIRPTVGEFGDLATKVEPAPAAERQGERADRAQIK